MVIPSKNIRIHSDMIVVRDYEKSFLKDLKGNSQGSE